MSEYISIAEAAKDRGLTVQAIYSRVANGRVGWKWLKGQMVVNLADVRNYKKRSGRPRLTSNGTPQGTRG